MGGPDSVMGPMGQEMPRVINGQYLHSKCQQTDCQYVLHDVSELTHTIVVTC